MQVCAPTRYTWHALNLIRQWHLRTKVISVGQSDMPVMCTGLRTNSIHPALNLVGKWCLRTQVIRLTLHLICQWRKPVWTPFRFTWYSMLYANDVRTLKTHAWHSIQYANDVCALKSYAWHFTLYASDICLFAHQLDSHGTQSYIPMTFAYLTDTLTINIIDHSSMPFFQSNMLVIEW